MTNEDTGPFPLDTEVPEKHGTLTELTRIRKALLAIRWWLRLGVWVAIVGVVVAGLNLFF